LPLRVELAIANGVVADTTPPVVVFTSPGNGANVSGNAQISGAAGIRQEFYIDGMLLASGTGTRLTTSSNTRKVAMSARAVMASATGAAGNQSSRSITVNRAKQPPAPAKAAMAATAAMQQ
jgi:hypothetical protein